MKDKFDAWGLRIPEGIQRPTSPHLCILRATVHDDFYPTKVFQCFDSLDFHHIFPGLSIELWRRVIQSSEHCAPGDLARDREVL